MASGFSPALIGTMVRLQWAQTYGSLRGSVAQIARYVLSVVVALLFVVGAWAAGVNASTSGAAYLVKELGGRAQALDALQALSITFASFLFIMLVFIQIFIFGQGSSVGPSRLRPFGIAPVNMTLGLMAVSALSLFGVAWMLALLAWGASFAWLGVGVLLVGCVAGLLLFACYVALTRLIIIIADIFVTSNRAKSLFYGVSAFAFMLFMQLPSMLGMAASRGMNGGADSRVSLTFSLRTLVDAPALSWLSWLPSGAAVSVPFDVARGNWLLALAHMLVPVLVVVACCLACARLLALAAFRAPAQASTARVKGLGVFAHVPDTVVGAIAGRYAWYMLKDPRKFSIADIPFVVMVINVATFLVSGESMRNISHLGGQFWTSLFMVSFVCLLIEGNSLAYDGRSIIMQFLAGVRGKDDRLGRMIVMLPLATVYTLLLCVPLVVVNHDAIMHMPFMALGIPLIMSLTGVCCAIGLGAIVSTISFTPVPSLDKPFSSPQGKGAGQFISILIDVLGVAAAGLPTFGVCLWFIASNGSITLWLPVGVGVVNSVVALVAGWRVGGNLMDTRLTRIVAQLDLLTSLQR